MYKYKLNKGEEVWVHNNRTLMEIQDAINVMKICNRLPDCMWGDIKCIHFTNLRSIYSFVSDTLMKSHGDFIGVTKPNLSILEFIYASLSELKVEA